jgi:hypothetical protein
MCFDSPYSAHLYLSGGRFTFNIYGSQWNEELLFSFLFARRECDVKMYEMKKLYREVEALNSDGNKLVVGAFQMDGW